MTSVNFQFSHPELLFLLLLLPVIALLKGKAGGVASLRDLMALRDTGVIAGAISGRALYDGALDLREALAALR